MAFTPYVPSLADIYQQAQAIRGGQQRSQLADIQLQQAQQDQDSTQAVNTLLKSNPKPTLGDFVKVAGLKGAQYSNEYTTAQTNDSSAQTLQQYHGLQQLQNAVSTAAQDPNAASQLLPQVRQYLPLIGMDQNTDFSHYTPDNWKQAATVIAPHIQQLQKALIDPKSNAEMQNSRDIEQMKIDAAAKQGDLNRGVTLTGQKLTDTRDRLGQVFTNRRAGLNDDGTSTFGAGASSNLSGDAFLATLPSAQQAQVKALADGRMQFPAGFALKSPYWQQMLTAVSQYDPSFDGVNFNARASTRKDFTSGKSAQNIKSLNTAIGHLGALDSQIGGTASHSFTPLNAAENYLSSTLGGDAGPTRFSQTAGALASELTAVFRGSGGAEADVKRYLAELNPNASLEQKKAAVQNITELLSSRLAAIGDQYGKGMGRTEDPLNLLDPKAAGVLRRIQGGSGDAAAGSPGQSGSAPVRVSTPAEALQLPPGTQFVTPDGRVKVR
jgi:hypothetical protein